MHKQKENTSNYLTATQVKQSIKEWEKCKSKEIDKILTKVLKPYIDVCVRLLKDKEDKLE